MKQPQKIVLEKFSRAKIATLTNKSYCLLSFSGNSLFGEPIFKLRYPCLTHQYLVLDSGIAEVDRQPAVKP